MAVNVDQKKCNGCGKCIEVCPVNAIALENAKAIILKPKCIDCCTCVIECPLKAIS